MQKVILLILFLTGTSEVSAQSSFPDTAFTEYFRRSQGWTGGDATISIALPGGKTMWLFGDSYIDHYDSSDNTLPCLFQVRNCFTVQDSANPDQMSTYIDYAKNGIEQTYFKIGSVGNTVYWPGHGFVKNDTVFVFLEKYNGTTYAYLGNYLAKILLPSFTLLSITSLPAMSGITMGKAVLYDDATQYYYIYGNKLNWIVYEPYVARTKFENLVAGNWEFFTGNGWSTNAALAKKIGDDPVSPGFSVVKNKDRYYLVTQENGYLTCGLGRNIYSYSSSSAAGKFSGQHLLYTVDDQVNGHYLLTYNAQAHPEFTTDDALLISYNVNDQNDTIEPNACPSQCKHPFSDRFDADSYRPKFVRVPHEVMGIKSGENLQGIEAEPNPAINVLIAHLNSSFAQRSTISFINKMGQVMLVKKSIFLDAGMNTLQLDVSLLPADIYFMVIVPEDYHGSMQQWERKLIVKE
jgi:hypothetical protein